MGVFVIYYRRTVNGSMKRYEETVKFSRYTRLLEDDTVTIKYHEPRRLA